MQTSEGQVLWEQTQGCPQGSCYQPAFRNIVTDEILSVQWPQGVHLQAFADDFAFIVTDNTREGLIKLSKLALDKFKDWTDKNKLHVSMEKSNYVLFSKLDNPNRCSPSGHRSSTPPPTNPTRSNLCPSCSSKVFIQLFHRYITETTDYENKSGGIHTHPHNFLLHNQISFAENHRESEAKAIYTDGSKTEESTGSAYFFLENYGIIASWQGKLDHSNSVFQIDILAIKMTIDAASSLHRPIKIWTDSLSSLMAILNPKSHHSMVREIQTLFLSHKHIHLRWLIAHIGYLAMNAQSN
ncbi:hypothetical protein AVEN_106620-1 [Araneus ventricosus]|uniref:Reverse transcriptase domain-containing protein n=1 Tax=Araneus ventricosus TaxID=182803 RepID=A0A4Y2I432_ARAVE|nr:hypothetical protein AVEN_106620-1 [Araneus ventricosus]